MTCSGMKLVAASVLMLLLGCSQQPDSSTTEIKPDETGRIIESDETGSDDAVGSSASSAPPFEDLITVLAGISRYSGARSIHLAAQSMGNFVLTEALKTIDDRRPAGTEQTPLFDQVALAAPDINKREFRGIQARSLQRGLSETPAVYRLARRGP